MLEVRFFVASGLIAVRTTVNRGDTGQDGVIPVDHFRRRRVVKLPENK